MIRIRLPLGRTALFVVLLLATMVVIFPLPVAMSALGLREAGLSARTARGSIWTGALREANFGSLPIGDVAVGLAPLPLFVGRARVGFEGPIGLGAVTISRHRFALDDATVKLPVAGIFAPVPLATLEFDAFSAAFRDGRCDKAEGRVRATFAGDVAGLALAQGLSGVARCDAGVLLLPMTSASAMETLELRVTAEGTYRAAFSVRSTDPALTTRLTQAGFQPTASGLVLRLAGQL